ncbi:MAG: Lrp/AsnC family transcriptional regulator [Notoacmeibacter sp.]|nr:Lrp/AsnC family transcriptional regulator [Notoacmeibacter sp.]
MKAKNWEFVSTSDLDETEQAVLSQLKIDGRMSSVDIARKIGVTEATVRRKMARLLEDPGISIQAVVRPLRSEEGIAALVGLDVAREHITNVAELLATYSFVDNVYVTTGPFDVIMTISMPSTASLFDFLSRELSQIPGIKDSESYMIARAFKHAGRAYP